MERRLIAGMSLLALSSASAVGGPVSPPASSIGTTAAKPAPDTPEVGDAAIPKVPHPYDETADAAKAVDAALNAAKAADKRTLIVFGANWCPDCRVLAGVLTLDPVERWAHRHYQIVDVDVGRFNRNTDLADRFGIKLKAIPALVVVSPDGKVVNPDETLALGDAGSMNAQAVVDILARWAVAPSRP